MQVRLPEPSASNTLFLDANVKLADAWQLAIENKKLYFVLDDSVSVVTGDGSRSVGLKYFKGNFYRQYRAEGLR